jgi:Ser/Thr protein kinase RdoA (MazF antagonist)
VPDSFQELTPDRVLTAVERAGLDPTGHVSALVCLENRVYDLRLADGTHVVAKFYRPGRWSREALEEEHRFVLDLREAEVPVCAPLPLFEGRTLGEDAGFWFAVWPRTGGRAPDELSDAELPVLGRLLARLHVVGAGRPAPHRPVFDAASRLREPLETLEAGRFVPPSCARRFQAAALAVAELYEARSEGVPFHRIHGDAHAGNLLRGAEGWFFLDFDDFGIGPAVQDVWMLVPGRDAEGLRQRERLLEGYRQMRDFDDRTLELVEPLRAMRFVWYAAWIARRSDDAAFQAAFPHFGSESYWEHETRDLEEQLERILSAPGAWDEGASLPVGRA